MDYPAILAFGGSILGIVGMAIGAYGKLSSRFSELQKEIADNRGNINLLNAKIAETKEDILVFHNNHKEAIEHARNRFFAEFNRFDTQYRIEMENQKRLTAEVRQYLAKNTTFEPREYRDD